MHVFRYRPILLTATGLLAVAAGVWLWVATSPTAPVSRQITALALSASGRWLASGTAAGRIRIWDLERQRAVREITDTGGPLNDLQFHPTGEYLAIATKNITIVPVSGSGPGHTIRSDEANYGTVRFTSGGRELLTINGRGEIQTLDVATGAVHMRICCSTIYGEVAFGPDDALILGAGHWPGIWDSQSGRLIGRLTAKRRFMAFGPVALDAKRNWLYMGSQDGRVHVWDFQSKKFLGTSPPQQGYVRTISVLGQTGWVSYANQDGQVQFWNVERGEVRAAPTRGVTSNLVFDSTRLRTALGTNAGRIEFWDLIEGKFLGALPSGE